MSVIGTLLADAATEIATQVLTGVVDELKSTNPIKNGHVDMTDIPLMMRGMFYDRAKKMGLNRVEINFLEEMDGGTTDIVNNLVEEKEPGFVMLMENGEPELFISTKATQAFYDDLEVDNWEDYKTYGLYLINFYLYMAKQMKWLVNKVGVAKAKIIIDRDSSIPKWAQEYALHGTEPDLSKVFSVYF